MADKKTELTYQEYLAALGLYTLAQQAQRQSDAAVIALAKHLGMGDDINSVGHISDELYSPGNRNFDELLRLEGFTVLPE